MKRVLIVKTSSMGDLIHTLPALNDAVKIYPHMVFDWVVEESFLDIPKWNSHVDKIITIALRRWRKKPLKYLFSREWVQAVKELREQPYDVIVDAQGLLKSAFSSLLAKGPRWGYDWYSIKENAASLFYHHKAQVSKQMHAVERIRTLFALALNYNKPSSAVEYGITLPHIENLIYPEPSIVLFHGTSRSDKLWPINNWIRLAKLCNDYGYHLLLPWGNEQEKTQAKLISQDSLSSQILPAHSLTELAFIIQHTKGVVAVDTGLGHLTAALGVPAVSLYGPTNPQLVGTLGHYQYHGNLYQDSPTRVFEKLLELMHSRNVTQKTI